MLILLVLTLLVLILLILLVLTLLVLYNVTCLSVRDVPSTTDGVCRSWHASSVDV